MSQRPSAIPRGDLIALIGTTTRIFDECRWPNGALIEAPIQIPSYPAGARAAGFCVPGVDLPLAMLAMDALGRDVRPLLTPWLLERAQGFSECGDLALRYHPHGPRTELASDLLGAAALLLALQTGRSAISNTPLIDLLIRGLGEPIGASTSHPRMGALRWVIERLTSDSADPEADIALRFLEASTMAEDGEREAARVRFIETMAIADRDGHFPEWVGNGVPPRPMLRAHLAFLIAADALGEVAALPKSGYTSRKR